ncbi:methylmalonyl-CoA mutase family protein [Membranihabitans maritimus]|uniref:methylmalonyl-CoA mutase family protein n=1 Tax=Membranihabitans maritimus TaxID=2904244 RepID=UPI001F2CFCD8|nr:methylmalonyl-CoA mutase family protein [Membranihabitans maritimus]
MSKAEYPIRIVTAASLFDGHDAAINIMRRVMQSTGVEVIHLGHDRSVEEIVSCAIQEDVHAIAVTSYQGGHMEYFKYMLDLLCEKRAGNIKIFGGGGGVILPAEIQELHEYGIAKIYSPEDGREMGIQGMIDDLIKRCMPRDQLVFTDDLEASLRDYQVLGKVITGIEEDHAEIQSFLQSLEGQNKNDKKTPVLGVTGTGGAGKSSLVDELVRRFLQIYEDVRLGIISMDPSRRKSGGALLGDRIRMNSINHPNVYMRSMATRQSHFAVSQKLEGVVHLMKKGSFDLIILETSGIGQNDSIIVDFSNVSLYVMTPEFGAPSQLEKIEMLDFANCIALNKSDKPGADDALRDIRKQYRRNHLDWDTPESELPVFPTRASQFNDEGVNRLFAELIKRINVDAQYNFLKRPLENLPSGKSMTIIPSSRKQYLREISEKIESYNRDAKLESNLVSNWQALEKTRDIVGDKDVLKALDGKIDQIKAQLDPESLVKIMSWPEDKDKYSEDEFVYNVRNREIKVNTFNTTLSGTRIPKVAVPNYRDWGDLLYWQSQENFPGKFPYTAGIYPFRRTTEDATRMFAGEGGPERTNRRFHYVSSGQKAKRLSTAFDSVTLYGRDPDRRPDIFGKIGNAGVSICSVDDMKKLFSGFDLSDPMTSVSMTINGPAPAITAFFMHAAIDQQCEKYIIEKGDKQKVKSLIKEKFEQKNLKKPEYTGELPDTHNGLGLLLLGTNGREMIPPEVYENIKMDTLAKVRGTVQADILKEDQAQNTCIFSTDFSLKVMGDMQLFFSRERIRNFYSVSISGYHIAEAGANPITQLAFTLANGFTYVEYYLSRGLKIDEFAPNFSFFFSNGLDAEYSVIGRVARRIWAKAIKYKYGGNERSQKLKYHIQTSGRSLHAQEMAFNDIRTTLQALYAIYDNCNSLHTNAYDEAITTPTEESVRRAMAIQMIINKELGFNYNENPIQGAFIVEELTNLVEESVLSEFTRLSERGGVIGAMETMYQRGKIQDESMNYEQKKHDGSYPIIGVNTFLADTIEVKGHTARISRSTDHEKNGQIENLDAFKARNIDRCPESLSRLQNSVLENGNVFETLMEIVPYCSLGQITDTLFEVGGKYRRGM